jgi:F-type H+-transporting ATPase subunit b
VNLEWGKVVKSLNWTFVFNLINFAILLYLLKRILFKPALAYLDRRREQIAAQMEAARVSEEKAAQLAAQRQESLKAAFEQNRRTVEEAKHRAEEIIATAKADAKKEASRILTQARGQIDQERVLMEHELRRAYAEIAVLGASRVLDREVRLEDHRKLLDELIAEIDEEALKVTP